MRRGFGTKNRPGGPAYPHCHDRDLHSEILSQAARYGAAARPANLGQWDGRYLFGLR